MAFESGGSVATSSGRHPLFLLLRPSVVVGCLYVLLIGLDMVLHHHTVLYYVHLGPRFVYHNPRAAAGYDGQFYYQIARDPLHAASFLDRPAYRYQRIVYPLLVAALSFGKVGLIPYLLLLINFVSILAGTEMVAHLFSERKLSPWHSLAFGLYFGLTASFLTDLAEPLTYCLVCLGLVLMFKQRLTAAAIIWGLAVLSRESAALFPLGYIVMYLYCRRWRDASRFFLLSIVPAIAWYGIVGLYFHTSGLSGAPPFELIPFEGLFYFYNNGRLFWALIPLLFVPTVLSAILLAKEVFERRWKRVSWLIWLLNLVLVTNLSRLTYAGLDSAGRLAIGLVLAMLLHGLYTGDRLILRASQVYTLSFVPFAIGILFFTPT